MNPQEPDAGEGGAGAPPDPHESNKAPEMTRAYHRGDLTVQWYAKRCIHSAECIRAAPRVFDPRRRPWIDLQRDTNERIVAAVEACPTGALQYVDSTQREAHPDRPDHIEISVMPDGPLYVRGRIRVVTDDGIVRELTRAALCRCGKSRNQPFCDNSHRAT